MSCKVATALAALLVACLPLAVLPGQRPASTMSDRPTEVVNYAPRTFTADEKEAFAASPRLPCALSGRGAGTGGTKLWIKLTAPDGEPVHINMDQIASIRRDTEMPGASAQVDLASGKFQRVRENVEQVMQLVSPTSAAQENEDRPGAALVCSSSIFTQNSAAQQ